MGFFSRDVQLLTDGAVYSKMRELISDAEEQLFIVSPFIDPTGDFVRQILEAAGRKVDVNIWFRRDKLADYRTKGWCRDLLAAKLKLGTVEKLHSKIYANEKTIILTSMNFYSSSGENSFEIGIVFESDHDLAEKVGEYIDFLERHTEFLSSDAGHAKPAAVETRRSKRNASPQAPEGHCLRCNTAIALDPKKPYCLPHYEQWATYKNVDYTDKYCHECGKKHGATMRKPLCDECYD
jgi:phosphatidylserine/phosphatidylglycerophosphate/cardiolipin synthase-like enzyme